MRNASGYNYRKSSVIVNLVWCRYHVPQNVFLVVIDFLVWMRFKYWFFSPTVCCPSFRLSVYPFHGPFCSGQINFIMLFLWLRAVVQLVWNSEVRRSKLKVMHNVDTDLKLVSKIHFSMSYCKLYLTLLAF